MTEPEESPRDPELAGWLDEHFRAEREILEEASGSEPVLPDSVVARIVEDELRERGPRSILGRKPWLLLLPAAAGLLLWASGTRRAEEQAPDPSGAGERSASTEVRDSLPDPIVLGDADHALRALSLSRGEDGQLLLRWEDTSPSTVRTYNVRITAPASAGAASRELGSQEFLLETEWALGQELSKGLQGEILVQVEALDDDGIEVADRSAMTRLRVPERIPD